jgi:hypothetical protein
VPAEKAAHHSAEQGEGHLRLRCFNNSGGRLCPRVVAARMAFGLFCYALKVCDDLGEQVSEAPSDTGKWSTRPLPFCL